MPSYRFSETRKRIFFGLVTELDTYLVLDVEVSLDSDFGFFSFLFHWIGRVQEYWDAPF